MREKQIVFHLLHLYGELLEIEKRGILIFLDNIPASAHDVCMAHFVCEVGSYMRDYVSCELDNVEKLYFNYVNEL